MDNGNKETKYRMENGDVIRHNCTDIIFQFAGKRLVICTSPLGGGIRDDLTAVFNHCDLDPETYYCDMKGDTYEKHLQETAREIGLDPLRSGGLSTACLMNKAFVDQFQEKGIHMTFVLSGAISHNGRCAGDHATLWEENGVFSFLDDESIPSEEENLVHKQKRIIPKPGTINMILHIDAALTPGALAGAVMVMTEAKVSAIQTMQCKSCYSERIATGSGTDGIIVIGNQESSRIITQIRTDTRLGELISGHIERILTESIIESLK